jgi:hypothetical protein
VIQFNLLPDVKLAFLKAQRIKRLVMFASILLSVLAIIIFIVLVVYADVIQKHDISDLTSKIQASQAELPRSENLNKILTIQNQLNTIPRLDDEKPAATRLAGYLKKITPATARIAQVNIDFGAHSINLDGNADTLKVVNQFVDTLKFTKYSEKQPSGDYGQKQPAFSNVVLKSYGVESGKGANYEIDFDFESALFDNTRKIKLTVPNIITTRSVTQQPTNLFKQNPKIKNKTFPEGR